MSIFDALNTSASALTAQRLRMDVVSSNIANAQTTRAKVNENGEYDPYRRKMVVLESDNRSFKQYLEKASRNNNSSLGVKVSEIVEDEKPFKLEFNPNHPDADENGYVRLPNVDPLQEMVDLMSATRSYEANITAVNSSKSMLMKALEIGK
ncbi:flagellar basal body rod protein FlgC [Oceanobacillus caeni]|uniref:flagellar basal body rod protein FlgC n=1 Tax=Bacillaceae TaxID=186817 RepID=UPI000621ED07|nr:MULTISPECIES: flagellar basal body rod protein FlgC [Bacillaceae]KKE78367.1 flagellar basal body rod protein FlgC [Bacilli bacterium VT-13-104]PZD88677.1 flagellar basal body rod protein FlgC [Bacilli bacterium]MBU8790098.1 flagellar basal body rod protein FlgC [Oceanobacillus caeni]MCR1833257.1 flagellar basal body rod protein FlgC [Oceanobacillus caeni]PZD89969.1 flagellar basal body rod protein FlgC [Bacilli bacterium]